MPVFTEKRRYRPIGWKAHHLGYKQGIELETLSSPGEENPEGCSSVVSFPVSSGSPVKVRLSNPALSVSASLVLLPAIVGSILPDCSRPCFPAQYCPVSVPVVSRKSPENPSGRWDSSLRLSGHGVRINSSISISSTLSAWCISVATGVGRSIPWIISGSPCCLLPGPLRL